MANDGSRVLTVGVELHTQAREQAEMTQWLQASIGDISATHIELNVDIDLYLWKYRYVRTWVSIKSTFPCSIS